LAQSPATDYLDVLPSKDIDQALRRAQDPPPSPYACKEAPQRTSPTNPWDELPAEYRTEEPRTKRRKSRSKGTGLWVPALAGALVVLSIVLIVTFAVVSRSSSRPSTPVVADNPAPAREVKEPDPVSNEPSEVPVTPLTTGKKPRAVGPRMEDDDPVDSAPPRIVPRPSDGAAPEPPRETQARAMPERGESRRHDFDPFPWTPPGIPRVYGRTARDGDRPVPNQGQLPSVPTVKPPSQRNLPAEASQSPGDVGRAVIGSGFVVWSGGYILAPSHVVSGSNQVFVLSPKFSTQLAAKVIEQDEEHDLALLQIRLPQGVTLRPLGAAGDREISANEPVASIGFSLANGQRKLISGTIDALPDADNGWRLSFTARIDSGHSGGPLCDSFGNVIGMVATNGARNNPADTLNTAIPASVLTAFCEKHIKNYKTSSSYSKKKSWDEVERIAAGSVVMVVRPK
jgi:S1-C subfamily serine protease